MPHLDPYVAKKASLEQALDRSEKRYRLLIDTLPHGIQECDTDGVITLSNSAHTQMHGYEEGELLGKRIWELLDDESRKDELRDFLACLLKDQPKPTPYFSTNRTRDGQKIEIQTDWTYQRDEKGDVSGFLSAITDITESRHLSRIYNEAPVGLCYLDTQLRYIDINEWLAALNGLSVEEHLGRSVSELFPELAEGIESQLRQVIETGKPILAGSVLAETPAQPNIKKYFQHNYVAVKARDGTVVGVCCTVEEITERKKAEQTLQQTLDELEQRVEDRTAKLGEINRELSEQIEDRIRSEEEARSHLDALAHVNRLSTMGEMATGMAHELNQPLAAISFFSHAGSQTVAISQTDRPEKLKELFEKISEQSSRATNIIHRLRSLVQRTPSERKKVNIDTLVETVLGLFESEFRRSGFRVEKNLGDSNVEICVDEIQIQQVLVNLICNGLDAMRDIPHDRKILEIATCEISERTIDISVRDFGKGISPEDEPKIFDAFFSTKSHGMGMGLAISRSIVEAHGGSLKMTRNECRGITFRITLPLPNKSNRI